MQTSNLTLAVPIDLSAEDAKYLLATKLFETGRLSLGQAAELSGYSYRAFLEILGHQGVPIVNYSASDLEKELDA